MRWVRPCLRINTDSLDPSGDYRALLSELDGLPSLNPKLSTC